MILIPARNEGPRIGAVVRAARKAMPSTPVLVVVNGCTDDTAAEARQAGAKVVESEPGYARALKVGYQQAVYRWGKDLEDRWLVQLDADGQHPPEAIPELLAGLATADMVIGSRFVGVPNRWLSMDRRLGIATLGLWTSVLLGQRLRDVTSGFQALSGPLVASLAQDFPDEVADANVLVQVARQGFRLREVPVKMSPRTGGESMHGRLGGAVHIVRTAALAYRARS